MAVDVVFGVVLLVLDALLLGLTGYLLRAWWGGDPGASGGAS